MPSNLSDYLLLPSVGRAGLWVQLVNNATAATVISSSASGADGRILFPANPVSGVYTVWVSSVLLPANDAGWTVTSDNAYIIPMALGDVLYPPDEAGTVQTAMGLISSAGVPSNANGSNGWYCINRATGALYLKAAGVWALAQADSPMTAQDDLIVGGVAGIEARLPKGTDGQVLTVDPVTHHVIWVTPIDVDPTFAAPTVVLGSVAADGVASTNLRSDVTIAAFDATSPSTQVPGDAAVVGTAAFAARRDHKHAMTNPLTTLDDVIVGGAAGAQARLAKGADSTVLTIDPASHHVSWNSPGAGLTSGLITNMNVLQAAVALPSSALTARKTVRVWNPPSNVNTLYVGYANTVTAGAPSNGGLQGVPIAPGQTVTFSVDTTQVLYGITSAGTNVIQVEELG